MERRRNRKIESKGSTSVESGVASFLCESVVSRQRSLENIIKQGINLRTNGIRTNVLKFIDFIYTNKMPYGIIRVTFVASGSFSFYYCLGVCKKEISEQNSSKGHF